MQWIVSIREL